MTVTFDLVNFFWKDYSLSPLLTEKAQIIEELNKSRFSQIMVCNMQQPMESLLPRCLN